MSLTQHHTMTPARSIATVGLVGYLVALAVVLLNPVPTIGSSVVIDSMRVLHFLGLPWDFTMFRNVEFVANVVLLAPLSAFGLVIWRRSTWRDWTAGAFVLSLVAECLQGLLLPDRTASFSDIVANTLGGFLGAAAVTLVRAWRNTSTAGS